MVCLNFFQVGCGEGGDVPAKVQVFLLCGKLKESAQVYRVSISRQHRCLAVDRAKKRSAKHWKLREQRADLEGVVFVECCVIGVCHQNRLKTVQIGCFYSITTIR
ncbi:hypothetical protein SDC9_89144 [bioreactor metagenome]|uniref:Uncharacterized protein n=1 Tax=bioreactor metagenome TaxID=1076179 RepID=A0A644ZNE9_9ZZZZ